MTVSTKTFTVGQQVRVADFASTRHPDPDRHGFVAPAAFGTEGVVRSVADNGNVVVSGQGNDGGCAYHQTIHPAYLEPVEPTLAERFPVGRKVVVSTSATTVDGTSVFDRYLGSIAEVVGPDEDGDIEVTLTGVRFDFNFVGPEHLTLLPEGVELAVVDTASTEPTAPRETVDVADLRSVMGTTGGDLSGFDSTVAIAKLITAARG